MKAENLKRLLDVCYVGKRVVETLPELPEGMKPRHIHVLDAVYEAQRSQGVCRVSDVSARLNITTPSVTKLVQELEQKELLEKRMDARDKRVVLLRLTENGMACVKRYVVDLHREWAEAMGDITEDQVEETVRLIGLLRDTMPGKETVSAFGGLKKGKD